MNGYRTYIAAVVALAPTIASWFGFTLSPVFGEEFTALAAEVITVAGGIAAIYFRAKATVPGWLVKNPH